ncbi:MAG: hypothetical protein M1149_05655 [Candidatus Thermoplasmatota archaeon]|jgi:hypothetical protein|nr:hypothetical protein [Candidatus Thermoplasmatota archaeon]
MQLRRARSKFDQDKDVLLRSYIAQGIKLLYMDRKHYFSERSRDYAKIKEILEHISGEINGMVDEQPRMLVPSEDGFHYEKLSQEMADEITGFLNFITELPPPSYKIISKWRKSADIGMMRIPTLTFILYSTLEFKVPRYYSSKIDDYACISAAIIDILRESSGSPKVGEIGEKIGESFGGKINEELKNKYKKNIIEWERLGLLI